MEKEVVAQVKRSNFNQAFKQLKAGVYPKSRLKYTQCELTIVDNWIILNAPWAQYSIEAKTVGSAKVTFPLDPVSKVIDLFRRKETRITIKEKIIQFDSFSVIANTCFFENDSILRSIKLPVNCSEVDLLRLLNGRYTREELEFNKLLAPSLFAEQRFERAVQLSYDYLKIYGVELGELKALVKSKINISNEKI